jgi:triosephosphate isomerase
VFNISPQFKTPLLIINFKNYLESSGKKALDLAKIAEKVSKNLSVEIILAPPTSFISEIANSVDLHVISQHVDINVAGSTTGYLVPEILLSSGATGSLLNHSEHRIPLPVIRDSISRLNDCNMVSVLCAKDSKEASSLASFSPNFIAIEPPELIGSGIAVSKANPNIITDSVNSISKIDSDVSVICGAGIVTGEDVKSALDLGAKGILVSSGIIKSDNWMEKITELSSPIIKA